MGPPTAGPISPLTRPNILLLLLPFKNHSLSHSQSQTLSSSVFFIPLFPMETSPDDIADDLQSLSFNSTNTNRSTSSGSETTLTASSSSFVHIPSILNRPRAPSSDPCWSAVNRIRSESSTRQLAFSDLKFSHRIGSGDIGSVYLAGLKSAGADGCLFAAKVMDKKELASRSKEGRARTEREILESLDHPFLPTLCASIESPKWLCLLTEFCPGGDLHVLRQRQPNKRFDELAVRFYASEIVVAIEYLHMMGIVYRDLKPENVLVRSDGHIMLTDFDLSLKCEDSMATPQVITTKNSTNGTAPPKDYQIDAPPFTSSSCILPNCIVPAVSCFNPKRKRKKKSCHRNGPQFVAEPMDVRSMSFVGTHEYLAPEIVSGEGHGSAVDWWTLGVFVYELFYGVTPFRGMDNELTLANIVARALEFPKEPAVPAAAKDLISQLLVKDPVRRLGSTTGSSTIKHHSFFQGIHWALLRCTTPPFIPPPYSREIASDESCPEAPVDYY